jgi:transglutaminase-like putative cysteine protease
MRTLLALSLVGALGFAANLPAPRERSFSFEYAVTVKDILTGAHTVNIWLPAPHDDAFQRITNLHVDTGYRYEIATGTEDNRILHVRVADPKEPAIANSSANSAAEPAGLDCCLQPARLAPLDDTIWRWAREVVDAAGAKIDLEMARAIYNHVVATVKDDESGNGWGNGDIYYACDARRGNCTDFHAIFIGYARVVGIPAGYRWAEFYAKGIGWVPVDASEAAKNPPEREHFFGAHDENRVDLCKGRDVILVPKQQGAPLNYFGL